MGALRCCTTFRQPCGIILERGSPLHSHLSNGGLMPQYMVLRARGAYCTTWHPGDMVQVAAFPLTSRNIQPSQEEWKDVLHWVLLPAESIGSNGERRGGRQQAVPFPYFVVICHAVHHHRASNHQPCPPGVYGIPRYSTSGDTPCGGGCCCCLWRCWPPRGFPSQHHRHQPAVALLNTTVILINKHLPFAYFCANLGTFCGKP